MSKEPFKFTTCCICGKQYIKQVGSIYHVEFAGKTFQCCSYTCYNKALEVKHSETSKRYADYLKEIRENAEVK